MSNLLDEQYFTWLYSLVGSVKTRQNSRTYWSLVKYLYTKEFIWLIPNDDNRVEDGRDLRYEFMAEREIDEVDPDWLGLGCSMLELLLGLSRRLSFEVEGDPRVWFWHLLETLDLARFNDAYCNRLAKDERDEAINDILDRVIWRTYSPNGSGGLFPLQRPEQDQRDIELWYQLSAYLLEQN